MSGRLDSNQRPPEPHSGSDAPQGQDQTAVASSDAAVCTPVCTSGNEQPRTGNLDLLAAALLGLSAEDRARLAALLLGKGPTP
jgi:hypothetical protein